MAITRLKPRVDPGTAEREDAFIAGAPDAVVSSGRGIPKGKKEQITLTIAPAILDQVDELAVRMGQSRASWINMAIYQALESGFSGIKGERNG